MKYLNQVIIENISIFTFVRITTNSIGVWIIEGICWISHKIKNTVWGEMASSSFIFIALFKRTKRIFVLIDSKRTLVYIWLIGG